MVSHSFHFWNKVCSFSLNKLVHFHRAALNAGRHSQEKAVSSSVCPSVCPSVRPSVCQTFDKTEESSVQIFMPYEQSLSLVFREERWEGSHPFYFKFWVNRFPLEQKRRFSIDIRAEDCAGSVIRYGWIITVLHIKHYTGRRSRVSRGDPVGQGQTGET